MTKLSDLKKGESGTINSIENDDLSIKLMEMGCIPGEPIEIEQCGPNGDPICIKVSNYKLSLRINEASLIWINKTNI
jgi:ferrous iron transport protein A